MIGRILCRLGRHKWYDDHWHGDPNIPVKECARLDCMAIIWMKR